MNCDRCGVEMRKIDGSRLSECPVCGREQPTEGWHAEADWDDVASARRLDEGRRRRAKRAKKR